MTPRAAAASGSTRAKDHLVIPRLEGEEPKGWAAAAVAALQTSPVTVFNSGGLRFDPPAAEKASLTAAIEGGDAEAREARDAEARWARVRVEAKADPVESDPGEDGEPVAAPRAAPEVDLGEEAARFGSLVHRLLALPDPIDDGALEEAATALLAEHGLGRDDAREAAALAKATRSLPAVAAAREADLVYREQPFTCVLDGERVAGRFDLAYRKDGRWTLVDFKTARLSGPAEARARYGPQLDRYRRALAALTSEPVESALCLVRDGQLVALASEPGTPRRA